MIADIWQDIANIKDTWTIKNDYCARLEDTDKKTSVMGQFVKLLEDNFDVDKGSIKTDGKLIIDERRWK